MDHMWDDWRIPNYLQVRHYFFLCRFLGAQLPRPNFFHHTSFHLPPQNMIAERPLLSQNFPFTKHQNFSLTKQHFHIGTPAPSHASRSTSLHNGLCRPCAWKQHERTTLEPWKLQKAANRGAQPRVVVVGRGLCRPTLRLC